MPWKQLDLRAQRVMALARLEAAELGHNYIGTEHLLLGLAREGDGPAARLLSAKGLSLFQLRDLVKSAVPLGHEPKTKKIPVTPRCEEVLEDAIALARGSDKVLAGTEELFGALLRNDGGVAHQVLTGAGLSPGELP